MVDPSPPQPSDLAAEVERLTRENEKLHADARSGWAGYPESLERERDAALAQVAELAADNAALVGALKGLRTEVESNESDSEHVLAIIGQQARTLLAQPHPGAALLEELKRLRKERKDEYHRHALGTGAWWCGTVEATLDSLMKRVAELEGEGDEANGEGPVGCVCPDEESQRMHKQLADAGGTEPHIRNCYRPAPVEAKGGKCGCGRWLADAEARASGLCGVCSLVVGHYGLEPTPPQTEGWADKRDAHSEQIEAAMPTRTTEPQRHLRYQLAMDMVGNRNSKGALVALVNWLLRRIDTPPQTIPAELGREALGALESGSNLLAVTAMRRLREALGETGREKE